MEILRVTCTSTLEIASATLRSTLSTSRIKSVPSKILARNLTVCRPEDRHYLTISGTPEGAARLRKEIETLKTLNCKELGFSAAPSGRVCTQPPIDCVVLSVPAQDLYHWSVKFFGFPMSTDLGQDLANHHQIHPPPAPRWRPPPPPTEQSEKSPAEFEIKQTEIVLEMKFLPDFPDSAPLFRIISPHLHFADGTVMAAAIAHAVATAGDNMQVDRYCLVALTYSSHAGTVPPQHPPLPLSQPRRQC